VAEVVALEQQGFSGGLRQGVREAISEVEAGLVAAALPEIAIGVPGDTGLVVCHRFDPQFRDVDKLIEAPAGDGVAARVDDDRGLQVTGSGDPPGRCSLDGMSHLAGIVFGAENRYEGGGVDDHAGSPRSS
jgi:hypothetical protein